MIYGYLRKSNEEGVDSSFETQRYKITNYCNLKGLSIDEYFYDVCSGGTLISQRTQGILMSSKLKPLALFVPVEPAPVSTAVFTFCIINKPKAFALD